MRNRFFPLFLCASIDFKAKFDAIFRQQSLSRRSIFTHITSCVDRHTTGAIIGHVQDILLRANLETSALM